MYILGDSPRTQSDAFDALENVFGSEEFSAGDAVTVLEEVLDLDLGGARSELNRLIRSGTIEEV